MNFGNLQLQNVRAQFIPGDEIKPAVNNGGYGRLLGAGLNKCSMTANAIQRLQQGTDSQDSSVLFVPQLLSYFVP